ncbi:MAG: imidazole glycerol phosphate synthase subunit HisF [Anaerolineae bacterium]|nr:imidazole glycerol phosphate synthase subunit HisF [Anaerolineae bacterium]
MNLRIIPRLDIKGPNLVKGVHLEGLRVLGRPEDFARFYYQNGADELIYQDAVASLYGRNSLLEIIERTASEIFIPLTVGGGLRSVEDIRTVLRAGADKVAINTAAVNTPELIRDAALAFGSSTIVVSIEAIKQANGKYETYVDYGRESTGVDAVEWASRAADLGAGELLVTSIGQEGTGKGYDLELTRQIAQAVAIPVIALGGAGQLEHIYDVIADGYADAVSLASMLHYEFIHKYQFRQGDYQIEGNIEFLLGKRGEFGRKNITGTTIRKIKEYLLEHGVDCRMEKGAAGV